MFFWPDNVEIHLLKLLIFCDFRAFYELKDTLQSRLQVCFMHSWICAQNELHFVKLFLLEFDFLFDIYL